MKTQAWAALVASSMLASTMGIGAAERPQLKESINKAAKTLAARSSAAPQAAASQRNASAQEPVPSVRASRASCGCGLPSWLKYTLIGAAAAGGGYAVSQIGHNGHDQRGPMEKETGRR
jgi:hypothetical protein